MFKRKEIVTLCAATLAGVSAMTSLAPMVTFADVTKEGQTTVTYEGAPKPAEWGLSVPATLKLDKDADNGKTKWGYAKFEIVSADGSVFKDTTKDRTFNVKGKPKNEEDATNNHLRIISQDGKIAYNLMMNALIQGAEDPTDWSTAAAGSGYDVSNKASFNIESKSDGSIATSRNWLVGMHDESKNLTEYLSGKNLSGIISWTATEKTS